jgi:nitroreductase
MAGRESIMFADLVKASRSYRRFFESEPVSRETIMKLIDYARLGPSGANLQPLKYFISYEKTTNEKIFPTLVWATYLKELGSPVPGERPSGYIILLQDQSYKMVGGVDHGIAAQNILLGAAEAGLGGCMIGNVKRDMLSVNLGIPDNYEILIVITLGKPKETVVIDEIDPEADIKYWRDKDRLHHVPKRKLKDIIIN